MDWLLRHGFLQGQIQTKEPLETSLFTSAKRKRTRFSIVSATWAWKSQQCSRKSICTSILLMHRAVQESSGRVTHRVWDLQSRSWESQYFALHKGSKGRRHKMSGGGINAYCLQLSRKHTWLSLMGEADISQNQTHRILPVKGWCYPMSLDSKISCHFPLNSLLQHVSPNAYLQCSRFLLRSQKSVFCCLNKNLQSSPFSPTCHNLIHT